MYTFKRLIKITRLNPSCLRLVVMTLHILFYTQKKSFQIRSLASLWMLVTKRPSLVGCSVSCMSYHLGRILLCIPKDFHVILMNKTLKQTPPLQCLFVKHTTTSIIHIVLLNELQSCDHTAFVCLYRIAVQHTAIYTIPNESLNRMCTKYL